MKYLIFLAIFLTIEFHLSSAATSKCGTKADRRIDQTVSKFMTIGQTGRRFPEEQQEVPKFCKDQISFINQVENYTKSCLEKFSKQVSSVLVFTMGSQARGLCAKRSKRLQELMSSSECANTGTNELHKCHVELVDSLMAIKIAEDKAKIPLTCCAYIKMLNCVRQRLDKIDKCDDKKIETIVRFVESLSGSAVDVLCPNREEETGKCSRFNTPKKPKGVRRPKAFFMPMIEVLDSIPEDETTSKSSK